METGTIPFNLMAIENWIGYLCAYPIGGELGRIVVDADVHPALIPAEIIDAIGHRLTQSGIGKIVQ